MRAIIVSIAVVSAAGLFECSAHEDLDTRIKDLDMRVAISPRKAELYARRADLHRRHRDWTKAIRDYQTAEQLQPERAEFKIGRAQVYLDRSYPEAALKALASLEGDGKEEPARALILRARALTLMGEIDSADSAFTAAIDRLKPCLPEHFVEHSRALANANSPRIAQAISVLDRGIRELGPLISLQTEAYQIERDAGQLQAALNRVRTIIAEAPSLNPAWLLKKAELLTVLENGAEARETYLAVLAAIDALPPRRRATAAARHIVQQARVALEL